MAKHLLSKAFKQKKMKLARKLNQISRELYKMCRHLRHG